MTVLVITNNLLGGVEEYSLDAARYTIGRSFVADDEDPADIVIPSRQINKRHASVEKNGDGWHLSRLGALPTTLNNVELEFGQTYPFGPDDLIQIGEYSLRLVVDVLETKGELDDASRKQIIAIENGIHSKLLDVMDLRQNRHEIDLENEETVTKIRDLLDKLIGAAVAEMEKHLLDELMRVAVYRRLNREVTFAGSQGVAQRYSGFDQPYFERQLDGITSVMVRELELDLQPKTMKTDTEKLDANYETSFLRHKIDFGPGLQDYIVRMFLMRNILDLIFGLGPLQDLLDAPTISEIMVVCRDRIFVEKFGVVEDSRREFYNDTLLMATIERIVAPAGRRIDKSTPMVDTRLQDGSRVNAIIPPLAIRGPCLTIRKFSKSSVGLMDLVGFGALTEQMANFLIACVSKHLNLVISGGTGSGKTTMLNALSSFIGSSERVVTIEDTAELQLNQEHVVTLETRNANMEGKGEVTMRDLLKNSLRMRPDRIVVGECRGGETLDMLQAMNTGHDGSMTTGHANNPQDMMKRLETMVLTGTDMPVEAIRVQIASAVNLVVQLNRFNDGARRVTHVSEVTGIDEETGHVIVEDIFLYLPAQEGREGRHVYTGYIPRFLPDMVKMKLLQLEDLF